MLLCVGVLDYSVFDVAVLCGVACLVEYGIALSCNVLGCVVLCHVVLGCIL